MNIKSALEDLLKSAIKKMVSDSVDIKIEVPSQRKNGDYSTNIALELVKSLNKNPSDIAKLIVDSIDDNEIIENIEIAGPGFINFFINCWLL